MKTTLLVSLTALALALPSFAQAAAPTDAPADTPADAPTEADPGAHDETPPEPPAPPPSAGGENPFGDTDRLRIAVMELKASEGIPPMVLSGLTDTMTEALDALGPFKAISSQDISRMMDFEAQKEAIGCSEASCLAEMVGAMGAEYLVTGSVALIGEQYLLQLQLFDIVNARVVQRESRDHKGSPSELFDVVSGAVKVLVRDLLAERAGTLVLSANEAEVTVRIDDRIVGVTPMPALEVAGGTHKLELTKEGFVTTAQDIDIVQGKTTTLDLRLRPSPAYRDAYAGEAWLWRGLAFGGMGVGAVALIAGGSLYGGGFVVADGVRTRIDTYNADSVRKQEDLDGINRDLQLLNVLDIAAITGVVVGVAAVTAGVTAFLLGPDPGRYDE